MIKGCIFDLDGTLTDTLESLTFSVNRTLEEMKLGTITKDQCRRFVGNGARCLVERALNAAGDTESKRLEEGMEVYGRIFREYCTYHVTPYKGVPEMLKRLQAKGVKLSVLSNKPHGQTVDVVKEFFGENIFDQVQGQDSRFPKKPNPAGVYHLLKEMGISREECLYVGDSEVDVATGAAAGMKCVAVTWGFRGRKELKAAGAEYLIDTPEQLSEYV